MTGVVGRFAPSPSGPLHFGSVTAALGSYLQARAQGGRWLLRIDDLDPPREVAGAADQILATLHALALEWDGEVVYQSTRKAAYAAALASLASSGASFECACSRREVGKGPYPGTCRHGMAAGKRGRAIRVRVDEQPISFVDVMQGPYVQCLGEVCGDFVIRRADGLVAYHLAVVVDDAAAGVTEVVRGVDLLDSTPRQIHLQRMLGLPQPRYAHLPVVLGANGVKLSKQTCAAAVLPAQADRALYYALDFLGLQPPGEALGASASELLSWALPRWRVDAVGVESRRYSAAANIERSSA